MAHFHTISQKSAPNRAESALGLAQQLANAATLVRILQEISDLVKGEDTFDN